MQTDSNTRSIIAGICLLIGIGLALFTLPPGVALLCGIALAVTVGNPWNAQTSRWAKWLLQMSVAGLGAGMNILLVAQTGAQGIGYTIVGIAVTMATGLALARWLRVPREAGLLLSVGTAICGGSAIAAVAATIRAGAAHVSVALATVFALNALGLWIFPVVGHWLALSAPDFGLWSALAIHDTSSVVGAALAHSEAALQIATPIKLARALWIVPITLVIHRYWPMSSPDTTRGTRSTPPWFILGFLLASALVTWWPTAQPLGLHVAAGAKRLLVVTLFLIGATLSRSALASVGWRPLAHGTMLWLLVASTTLVAILGGWIEVPSP